MQGAENDGAVVDAETPHHPADVARGVPAGPGPHRYAPLLARNARTAGLTVTPAAPEPTGPQLETERAADPPG